MESFGDLMSVPPMYRDIGSTFLAQQMPIPMYGMPYAGGYGISPMKQSLTSDKFETIRQNKEKQNKQIKKTLGIIGGVAASLIAFAILKKKVPAVGNALTKAWQSCKTFVTDLFKKAPKP